MLPTIDAIIPVLNGSKTIEAAIYSALIQVGVDVRVTVIDAGSNDGTIDVVNGLNDSRIQLLAGNGSLYAGQARNIGIEATASPWIGMLDADDLWPQDRSSDLLRVNSDPDNEISVGHMVTFPDGAHIEPTQDWSLVASNLAPNSGGVLLSRSVFKRVGSFDEQLPVGEFIDWMARARSLGIREVTTDAVVLARRNHAANTSRLRRVEYAPSVLRIAIRHRTRQRLMTADVASSTEPET